MPAPVLRSLHLASALALGGLLPGCTSPPEPAPTIRVAGAETMANHLLPQLADAYARAYPEDRIAAEGGGSAAGFRALAEGQVDLAATSRRSLPDERAYARTQGIDLEAPGTRNLIAVNVVAVAVHPQNPLDAITYDQIIGIFCTGTIDDWAFLSRDPLPILPLARDPSSGTRAVFEDFFCGPRGLHPSVRVVPEEEMAALLASEPGAVAFENLADNAGRIVALRPEPTDHPVLPSQQNVIRGAYPLYNDLYLYTDGTPSPEVARFLGWVVSPSGQDVVDEGRFVPLFLRPDRMDHPRPMRETLHFETGRAAFNQRSLTRLPALVEELRARAGEYHHIVLEGYADTQEPDPAALSRARADALRARLARELPEAAFEVVGRGTENPVAPNSTPQGRQQNRRVQVYLAAEEP